MERPRKENIPLVIKHFAEKFTEGNLAALARKTKVPKNTFHSWYSGAVIPTLGALLQLSSCFGITLTELVTGVEPLMAKATRFLSTET
jgi:transcriptional regulator with XRE-family HTH domain